MSISVDCSRMHFLFDLPGLVAAKILDAWLPLKIVCALDSAFCSHVERTSFLSLLAAHTVLSCDIDNRKVNRSALLTWLQARNIRVSSIYLPCGMERSAMLLQDFFARTGALIKTLRVTVNHEWTAVTLVLDDIADHCPSVEELHFQSCSVKDIQAMAKLITKSSKLTNLKINGFQRMDTTLVDAIVHVGSNLANLELVSSISNVDFIGRIAAACPNVIRMNISRNGLNDAAMESVVRHCPLLEELCLHESHGLGQLTDRGMSAIAGLRHLHTVDLTTSRKITDVGIIELVRRNPNLVKLYIGDNDNITNKALLAIAKHCTKITHLEVYFCDKGITDKGVLTVAEKCKTLKQLSVSLYGKVTKAAVNKLGTLVEVVKDEFWR